MYELAIMAIMAISSAGVTVEERVYVVEVPVFVVVADDRPQPVKQVIKRCRNGVCRMVEAKPVRRVFRARSLRRYFRAR